MKVLNSGVGSDTTKSSGGGCADSCGKMRKIYKGGTPSL